MIRAIKINHQGQALIEFAISFPAILAAAAVSILLFRTEWNRTRCARQAFLAAHQALRTEDSPTLQASSLMNRTQVEKTDTGVLARTYCGQTIEEVRLPDLEHAQW